MTTLNNPTNPRRGELICQISRNAIKLHRAFMHELDFRLQRASNLTAHQFSILLFVRNNPKVAQAQIAKEFHIEAQTVVKLIDAMERSGWVVRITDKQDRRVRRIDLGSDTQKLEAVFSLFENLQQELLFDLSVEELESHALNQRKMEISLQKNH